MMEKTTARKCAGTTRDTGRRKYACEKDHSVHVVDRTCTARFEAWAWLTILAEHQGIALTKGITVLDATVVPVPQLSHSDKLYEYEAISHGTV
jgi:hypothetical protein